MLLGFEALLPAGISTAGFTFIFIHISYIGTYMSYIFRIFHGKKPMVKTPGYKAPTDARLALEPKMEEVKASGP